MVKPAFYTKANFFFGMIIPDFLYFWNFLFLANVAYFLFILYILNIYIFTLYR
jgi:hypothetical protein